MRILPTLQKSIRRAFLRLVLLFGVLGLLLVAGIYFAGRMPILLLRMNYDSIAYAQKMEEALTGMQFPDVYMQRNAAAWKEHFQEALHLAQGNITESDEQKAVQAIEKAWQVFLLEQDGNHARLLHKAIAELVNVNEQGMFRRLDKNSRFRDIVILVAASIFILGTLWAFLLADSIATRLSHPLRRASGVLKERPPLGQKLHLPDPQALEVRILFDELSRLWGRLGELDALNVGNLVAEKRKLEVILDSAEDAVLVLDATGCVAHLSARMIALLGLPRETLLGQPWTDISSSAATYLALRAALRVDMQGVQDVLLRGNNEELLYTARRRDLLDSGNGVVGQVFLLSNVTEKRRRDALRSEMMDWISHELKTPMQSLGLAADLLSRQPGLGEEMQMLVDTVSQDTARLRIVARQFMDIAKMSPLALQLSLEEVDLAERLPDWLVPFQLVARESGIRFAVDIAELGMDVTLDTERFAWVVSNLVSNALRVCPAGSRVRVVLHAELVEQTEQEGRSEVIMLRVEDNGPGIPKELAARLFEPYSHGRTAGKQEGLVGLGLAIAHTIVEAHGGSLQYAPRTGGGSVFTVYLPSAHVLHHTCAAASFDTLGEADSERSF
ncbi:MAG: ATP-binding protein [Bilophila sp.]